MDAIKHNRKKVVLNIRHSPEIDAFINEQAAINNEFPSALRRKILNAGLESMYQIKIENNQIVVPPPSC